MKNVEKPNNTVLFSTFMAAQNVVCFDHVTNWSGGGDRAGPRNHGNPATAVEFWEKQNGG